MLPNLHSSNLRWCSCVVVFFLVVGVVVVGIGCMVVVGKCIGVG